MNNFEKYGKEFYLKTKNFKLEDVLTHYDLPNSDSLHSMICGYANDYISDTRIFDDAESIDYFKYEKVLWSLNKKN